MVPAKDRDEPGSRGHPGQPCQVENLVIDTFRDEPGSRGHPGQPCQVENLVIDIFREEPGSNGQSGQPCQVEKEVFQNKRKKGFYHSISTSHILHTFILQFELFKMIGKCCLMQYTILYLSHRGHICTVYVQSSYIYEGYKNSAVNAGVKCWNQVYLIYFLPLK
jgi:hypothetical protein